MRDDIALHMCCRICGSINQDIAGGVRKRVIYLVDTAKSLVPGLGITWVLQVAA